MRKIRSDIGDRMPENKKNNESVSNRTPEIEKNNEGDLEKILETIHSLVEGISKKNPSFKRIEENFRWHVIINWYLSNDRIEFDPSLKRLKWDLQYLTELELGLPEGTKKVDDIVIKFYRAILEDIEKSGLIPKNVIIEFIPEKLKEGLKDYINDVNKTNSSVENKRRTESEDLTPQ